MGNRSAALVQGREASEEASSMKTVSPRKAGKAMLIVWLGTLLLSGSLYWLKYRPSGVDRYAPAFTEAGRVVK
jgi:hypothetical protein